MVAAAAGAVFGVPLFLFVDAVFCAVWSEAAECGGRASADMLSSAPAADARCVAIMGAEEARTLALAMMGEIASEPTAVPTSFMLDGAFAWMDLSAGRAGGCCSCSFS